MPLYLLCSFLPNESKWLQLVHLIIWYALVSSDCFYEMLFITLPAALQSFLYTSHHPSTRLEGLPCLRLTTDLLRPTPSEHGQTMTNHLPVGSVLLMFFSWRSRLSEQRTTWHHVTLPNMSQQFWFIFVHCAQLARSSARVATPCWSTDDTLHSTHHKLRTSMVRMIDTSGSRKSTAQNEFGHLVSLLSKDPGLQQVQDTKKHIKFRLWRNQLC